MRISKINSNISFKSGYPTFPGRGYPHNQITFKGAPPIHRSHTIKGGSGTFEYPGYPGVIPTEKPNPFEGVLYA